MTTIFSIEDEEALVSLLEYNIKASGFKFEHSTNGYDAMMKLQKSNPDLIYLIGCCRILQEQKFVSL